MPVAGTASRERLGIALCLVSACGFALMAIFAKEAYAAGVGVTTLLAVRFVLASGAFWAIAAVRRPARPPRRVLLGALALGAIGYAAQAGLFFSALEHIDASLTSLLLYTYPALVFCGAVALGRERATRTKIGALVLASAGAALVLLGGDPGSLEAIGVVLGLGAAVAYSTYILVADTVVERIDPFLLSAMVATGAAVTFVVAGVGSGSLDFGFDAVGWVHILGIALFSTVVAMSTFFLGLERVGASTASIVSTVEPVVTVALAVAVLGEALGPAQVAGGALVLAAVVALQRRGSVAVDGASALPAPAAPARTAAREAA